VSDDYLSSLLSASEKDVDVISFRQAATWNGEESEVRFSLKHSHSIFNAGGITERFPWHVCAWRRELAQAAVFTEKQWGEDADWVRQIAVKGKTEIHIPRILHYYNHGSGSLAF